MVHLKPKGLFHRNNSHYKLLNLPFLSASETHFFRVLSCVASVCNDIDYSASKQSQCLTFSHLLFWLCGMLHASWRLGFFHQQLHNGTFLLFPPPPTPATSPQLDHVIPPPPRIYPSLLQSFFPCLLLLSGTVVNYSPMNRSISKSQHFLLGPLTLLYYHKPPSVNLISHILTNVWFISYL